MSGKYLHNLSNKYSRAMHPCARIKGGALALGMGATVYGLGMGAMAIQASNTGKSFVSEWRNVRAEYGNTWRNGTLGIIIGIYLLVELGIGMYKSEAKHYAEFIVKRYLRDLRYDISNIDERVFYDVANLILANMSDAERKNILDAGIVVSNALDKNNILSVSGEQSAAQGRIKRKKLLIESKNNIAKHIDTVIGRNPELEYLIADMLKGKTYFNPMVFNQKQR